MRLITLLAVSALSISAVAPAFAEDAMKDHMGSAMKMSAADKKMQKCNAMSHDAMMKNAGCKKLMKAHPDAMGAMGGGAMSSGAMGGDAMGGH